MMLQIPNFDTNKAVRDLTDSGLKRDQAELFVQTLVNSQTNLVTKTDLKIASFQIIGTILIGVPVAMKLAKTMGLGI